MLSSMKEHRKETLSFNIEELGWRSPSGNLPWEAIHQASALSQSLQIVVETMASSPES